MNHNIKRTIEKLYKILFNKIFTKKSFDQLAKNDIDQIMQKIVRLQSSKQYNDLAKRLAEDLAKKGIANKRGTWRKFYELSRKQHLVGIPMTYREYEFGVFNKAIDHNFTMIKSIPQEFLKILNHKYTSTLIEEVAKGSISRGSFQRQLQSHGWKNAKLIARTETAKLQTAITELRATDLGSVAYTWRSSHDPRTRPSHRAMNDVVVFWRADHEKPHLDNMWGNAGEFPNCRCDAQPIMGVDRLTKSNYKVYNYKTEKVETMTKQQLAEAIEKKSL